MLDISIRNAEKELDTEEKKKAFLQHESLVTEKVDGTKLTVVRNDKPFDKENFFSNFIVAYKGSVIYEEDFAAVQAKNVKKFSIGNAQYFFVVEHFRKINHSLRSLPKNTEFFIEFVMQKPTLTRDYHVLHNMILIGYSRTTFKEEAGVLKTFPENFLTDRVEEFATTMKIDSPRKIFKGKLYPYEELKKSGTRDIANCAIKNEKKFLESKSFTEYFSILYDTLMSIPSKYGGEIEGVVVTQEKGTWKLLQHDQHDKEKREAKKRRYQMEPEREAEYFLRLKDLARKQLDKTYAREKRSLVDGLIKNPLSFRERMKKLSFMAYQTTEMINRLPYHEKKNLFQKQEDFHYVLKYLLIRDLPIHNNAIFIGRFQPPSKAHISIIENALSRYQSVTVAIVKGKKSDSSLNPFGFETQKEILQEIFPGLHIIQVSSGNLFTAMQKAEKIFSAVLCGSDRSLGYEHQLRHNPEIKIDCLLRDSESVSGTKIRESLLKNDKQEFCKNVHQLTKKHFEKLRREIMHHIDR